MDIRRLLHNPDDGGWFVISETRSEQEMNDFRRSLKRNAIINTHLVNCTMNHADTDAAQQEHKMKVQWTKCTSALCHPKNQREDGDAKRRSCPVQLRMSTCQLTFKGIVCQAYDHLSDEHDAAEPLQSSVTEDMKIHIARMLECNPDVKPMVIYKELQKLHDDNVFGDDLMPTKIQLRNALTYLRSRRLRVSSVSSTTSSTSSRKRKYADDSSSSGDDCASPPCVERRFPE
jgi:hypothetical protein